MRENRIIPRNKFQAFIFDRRPLHASTNSPAADESANRSRANRSSSVRRNVSHRAFRKPVSGCHPIETRRAAVQHPLPIYALVKSSSPGLSLLDSAKYCRAVSTPHKSREVSIEESSTFPKAFPSQYEGSDRKNRAHSAFRRLKIAVCVLSSPKCLPIFYSRAGPQCTGSSAQTQSLQCWTSCACPCH